MQLEHEDLDLRLMEVRLCLDQLMMLPPGFRIEGIELTNMANEGARIMVSREMWAASIPVIIQPPEPEAH